MANIDLTQFRDVDVRSTKRICEGIYTGPVSYVTGGDAFLPAEVKLGQMHLVQFAIAMNAAKTAWRLLVWDPITQTVVWVIPSTGAEVAGAVDLSTFTSRFSAVGL